MVAALKTLVNTLLNPLNTVFLLGVLSLIFYRRRHQKGGKILGWMALSILVATGTDWLPDVLMEHLEEQFSPYEVAGDTLDQLHILVLGSGHTADPDLPPQGQLGYSALARLTEGLRIRNTLHGACKLLVSGYGNKSSRSQADVLAEAAQDLTEAEIEILTQASPSNTAEEAEAYLATFGKEAPLILVTSAAHMPRAMYIFERRGLQPIPAPCDFRVKKDPEAPFSFSLFSSDNFQKVHSALHEYIGILWEKWFVKV